MGDDAVDQRVHHLSFSVTDLDRSAAWYQDITVRDLDNIQLEVFCAPPRT